MAKAVAILFLLIVIVSASFWGGVKGESNDCSTVILNLSPCLGYVTGKIKTPSPPCCSSLETVVATKPRCLCEVVNGTTASSLGIKIDPTRALQLPAACNINTPPVSRCKRSPSSAPSPAPEHFAGNGSSNRSAATRSPTSGAEVLQTQLSFNSLQMFFFVASFIFIN